MTRRHYYLLAAFFPFLIPTALYGIMLLIDPDGWHSHDISEPRMALGYAVMYLGYGALIGGLPYIAILIWLLMNRHEPADWMKRISWYLPLIHSGSMTILGGLLTFWEKPSWSFSDIFNQMGEVGAFCLVFGYGYVLFTHGLCYLLQKTGMIRD